MEERILPCPFCKSEDIRLDCCRTQNSHGKKLWSISCHDCGATFTDRYHKYLVVAAWNKRHGKMAQYDVEEVLEKIEKYKKIKRYAPYTGWNLGGQNG